MKKNFLINSIEILFLLYLGSCNSGTSVNNSSIATDSATIAAGEISFNRNCSGCHNFKQDGIGPQLSGITTKVSSAWIEHFIQDPQKTISSGDEHAQQLFKKYKVVMPSFSAFKEDEMNGLIAFLNVHKQPSVKLIKESGNALSNPITETIKLSNLVVGLQLVTKVPPSSDSGKLPLTRITKLSTQPHSNSLFLVDLRGKLYKLVNNKATVYMDLAKLKAKFINEPGLATGFGSFAFHPEFPKNGLLYTTHTEAPNSGKADFTYPDSIKVTLQWVLTEWKANDPSASTFSGTSRELLRINMVSGIHGVQEITFNPVSKPGDEDYGLLYMGIGDGGAVEEGYPFIAHSKERIWGTVLRIDPTGRNGTNRQYGIPIHNPFVQEKDNRSLKEIYAYGFRNPHRITWGRSGEMFVSNVGHGNIESLDLIVPGHDYGWPIREGTFVVNPYGDLNKVYSLPSNDSIYKITYPVTEYDHDEGKAISGGYEYWGHPYTTTKGKIFVW